MGSQNDNTTSLFSHESFLTIILWSVVSLLEIKPSASVKLQTNLLRREIWSFWGNIQMKRPSTVVAMTMTIKIHGHVTFPRHFSSVPAWRQLDGSFRRQVSTFDTVAQDLTHVARNKLGRHLVWIFNYLKPDTTWLMNISVALLTFSGLPLWTFCRL